MPSFAAAFLTLAAGPVLGLVIMLAVRGGPGTGAR